MKMFLQRRLNFLQIFAVLMLNGCQACFRTNEHQISSRTTGSSFYQECQCTEPGYAIHNLIWLDNNNMPVPLFRPGIDSNVFVEEQSDSLNLHISSITKAMSGTYKCITHVEDMIYTQNYTITAYEPLYFYDTPNEQYLVYGHNSLIKCQPISDSTVLISWHKGLDDSVEINTADKYLEVNDGLYVNNVTQDDAGEYKCTARVIVTNEEVDKYISVKITTIPEIIELKPTLHGRVVVGDNLTIECIADGTPHPQYVWNKTLTEENTNKTWSQELNTINFNSIQPEDTGMYACYALNSAGYAISEIYVEVFTPPTITYFPNITEVEGSTIQLICNATGNSVPNISITYLGRDLNSYMDLLEYEEIPNMAFVNLDRSQKGIYECNATNEVSSVQKAIYLSVLHRPYFDEQVETLWGWDGKSVNLSCIQDSNPPAKISWRFQGNDITRDEELKINKELLSNLDSTAFFVLTIDNDTAYGVYECSAKNEFGEATKLITLKEGFRPNSVKNATYEEIAATSVSFIIEGPDHVNGPSIQAFTAQYDEAKNYNITDIHINRTWSIDRPFKLDKLKPNTTYNVRFAALNEVGTGEWSKYIEFTTLETSVPEPPEWEEEPITLTSNSHVLKWKAPDDNGEPIDYYTLRYCLMRDEELCKTQRISPTTKLELADLQFNTTYTLELIAHNAEGDSIPANISVIVPSPMMDPPTTLLSSGAIIGISIVIVVLCLLLLDVLLLVWRRQGIIATCCFKKDTKRKEDSLNTRDKKVLLTNGEKEEPHVNTRPKNGHKEFEYDKNTGVVTGKHSAV